MRHSFPVLILVFSFIFSLNGLKPAFADIITLKESGDVLNGRIMKETDAEVTVKLKTGGTARFPRSWIKDIKKEDIPESELYTKQDTYLMRSEKIDPKDAKAQLDLAEWCLKNSTPENNLADMAIRHFNAAKEIDPALAAQSGKELRDAVDKKAGELYKLAETDFNIEQYYNSERMLVSIIAAYPESANAGKSKELLAKIWGKSRADKILNAKDDLPEVALSSGSLSMMLSHLGDEKIKEKYLAKCMNKARDYEERAGEVAQEKRMGYYMLAISCYDAVQGSDKDDVKESAKTKVQQLLKDFFDDNPVPPDDAKLAQMTNFLNIVEDKDFVAKVADRYFKIGEGLNKKAKKLKQPEKGQKAQDAFFCLSLANNFSKDEKIRQSAADLMSEAQRLERAKK